jgi:hypothetical protein
MSTNLYTWTALRFGGLSLAFEVNDRYPGKRLTLEPLRALGAHMAGFMTQWLATPAGMTHHTQALAALAARAQALAAYRLAHGTNPRLKTHELVDLGY